MISLLVIVGAVCGLLGLFALLERKVPVLMAWLMEKVFL